MIAPEKRYQKRVEVYSEKLDLYTQKSGAFGNYKLLVFFIGIALAVILYIFNQFIFMSAQIILFLSAFIYLTIVQNHIIKRRNYSYAMHQINKMCLKRTNGEWTKFSDIGEEFENQEHNYTYDLDIFGRNSLFQMINMTSTYSGRHKLAKIFLNPLEKKEDILERQEAISELSNKLMFRQRMLSNAIMSNKNLVLIEDEEINSGSNASISYSNKKKRKTLLDTMNKLEDIYAWAKQENKLYSSNGFKLLITVLPVLTLSSLLFSIFGAISPYIPIIGFVIQFLMLAYKANYRSINFEVVEKYTNTLKVYSGIIKQFESEKFQSDYVNGLKRILKGKSEIPAWKQIDKLSKLWELIANRYNLFHAIINIATLWDYHCLVRLEKWKINSGKFVQTWFDVIGEVEALSSMSILKHDNPEFIMPQIAEDLKSGIKAEQLGHPLLGKGRKCNDISFDSNKPILLITGSNMSGKSTFLRTVGISLLFSSLGLPVCAKFFKCPILKIYACMRTSDNLGQNVSSFYAELLRVKMIVEAVDRDEKVFFLLDEIFKGTNSADRHMGAKMLIRQLDKKAAWGMVSTHDLELADLEKESNGHIRNYHFKEYYKDDKIYFDYLLREGVSDTRNAIYLMRMAGVRVEG